MNKYEKSFNNYIKDSKHSFRGYKGYVKEIDYIRIQGLVDIATQLILIMRKPIETLSKTEYNILLAYTVIKNELDWLE